MADPRRRSTRQIQEDLNMAAKKTATKKAAPKKAAKKAPAKKAAPKKAAKKAPAKKAAKKA
jgi:hypothetical protein